MSVVRIRIFNCSDCLRRYFDSRLNVCLSLVREDLTPPEVSSNTLDIIQQHVNSELGYESQTCYKSIG